MVLGIEMNNYVECLPMKLLFYNYKRQNQKN